MKVAGLKDGQLVGSFGWLSALIDNPENVKSWWLLMGGGHLQESNHKGSLPRHINFMKDNSIACNFPLAVFIIFQVVAKSFP